MHLAECERCRRRLRETEAVAASLAYGVPQVAPPPELRSRVLAIAEPVVAAPAAAARSRAACRPAPARPRRVWWPRFAAIAVPAMALALVGMLAWNVSLRNDVNASRDNLAPARPWPCPESGTSSRRPMATPRYSRTCARRPRARPTRPG